MQLHTTTGDASVQTMQEITDLPIPAHRTAVFALDRNHLMLMNPTGVSLGATVPLLLHFRNAGVITVWAQVSRYGSDADPGTTVASAPGSAPTGAPTASGSTR